MRKFNHLLKLITTLTVGALVACSSADDDSQTDQRHTPPLKLEERCSNLECLSHGYVFTVTSLPNPRLQSACEKALERDVACGETTIDPHCAHFSKLEGPEALEAYKCFAHTPCGGSVDACSRYLNRSDLGTTLCAGIGVGCSDVSCDSEIAAEIDGATSWLAEDVLATAIVCLDEPCDGRGACLDAWFDAVAP